MEYFRRLLGAVQEALDYVSSFTTYLLGDETHPGAEESGHTRGLEHRSSCHDSEVESAHSSGDVSPQGYLDAFERPLTTEVTPFNQESRVASEAVVNGAQTTEAILEPSKLACKLEGQEVAGQKLSESPQFLADAPKPRPTATVTGIAMSLAMSGNELQRYLEGLALIQGLHQWESEGTSLMEAIQPEGLEEVGLDTENSQHWEPDRPLTGGNREREQNGVGGTDEAQQRKLEGTVWNEEIEQRTPDWALSVAEQPNGLKGAAWSGEIEHGRQLAKKSESQHLEEEEEEPPAAETVWDQQRETDRVEANEGIQKEMPERAETEGDQEGVLEEAERSHQWEPGKTVMAFEEQEWDPKWVAEEGNSRQSGLEGVKDTEDYQQGELEGPLKNEAQAEDKRQEEQMEGVWEGMSERLVEEEDLEEKVLEKSETRGMQPWEPEWTERSLQEEPTGSRASLDTCLYAGEQIVGEPEKLTEEREEEQEQEVVEVVMMEEAGTSEHRPWEPEGTERSLQEEPPWASLDMCVFGGEQIVGEPEKLIEEQEVVEGVMLEEAETEGGQPWELEGTGKSLCEEPTGSKTSLDTCLFGGEQIGEPEKMTEEVAIVVLEEAENGGHQPWEPEGTEMSLLHEEPKGSNASLDRCLFGEEQIVGEPEKLIDEQEVVPLVVLEEAETGGCRPWEPEGTEMSLLHEEPMGNRTCLDMCLFGEEQIVGEPEKLIEEQEVVEEVMLEEAETGGHQPWEPEGSLHDEEPKGSRASLDACLFGEEQIVVEPEKLTGELKEQEVVPLVVLEEVETGGHQLWEPEGTERSLHEEPMGNRASLDTCLFGGEQIVGEPEKLIEEVEEVMLEEAETGGGQPWEPEGTERSLHDEEPTGSRALLDVCSLAGPSTFPDEVLPLDTSAQKERVMLRRKSSIRRAPSLKKPRLTMENQPPAANITEDVPSEPQAPRRPNLRHSGFGPMHPNMMAELQMRLRRPQ